MHKTLKELGIGTYKNIAIVSPTEYIVRDGGLEKHCMKLIVFLLHMCSTELSPTVVQLPVCIS